MIGISIGKWNNAASRFFVMERIFRKGYKWTPFVRMRRRKKQDLLSTFREMVGIQGYDGNWNYDPYMHGMYNGMELMLSLAEGRKPVYRDAPAEWLCNRQIKRQVNGDPIGVEGDAARQHP